MALPSPNLDDRSWAELMREARAVVQTRCPEWTDLGAGDPGIVLLEAFAFLTDLLIHRLNRIPEKAYIAFLNLIGVTLHPPAAAGVVLRFHWAKPTEAPVEIPAGTRVTVGRPASAAEAPVFSTDEVVTVPTGTTDVDVPAHHCELVEGEKAGVGTGLPGLSVTAQRPPIILPADGVRDLMVGVEAAPEELGGRVEARRWDNTDYRIWREVRSFSEPGEDGFVYVVDRLSGTITFAPAVRLSTPDGQLATEPAALGEVPASGRRILLWYRSGGGAAGNVAAGTLTVLRDPLPGVEVTNPTAATGGRAAETLDNALTRGPQELHSLERAVTARDFEHVAVATSGAIARARAFTRADLWTHALPGTVEVVLVPNPPDPGQAEMLAAADVEALQTPDALARVQSTLDQRRPLGTSVQASWAHYKIARVETEVILHRAEDPIAAKARLERRLRQAITPLPVADRPGWPFGQALRVSHVFDALLSERGVRYVQPPRLIVEEVPKANVTAIVADLHQPRTWYCASGSILFRSMDDGDGWEPAGRVPGETMEWIEVHRDLPGLVVAASTSPDGNTSVLRLSRDCGESWERLAELDFHVEGMAILHRGGDAVLLMATDRGLYQLNLDRRDPPTQVMVDAQREQQGFYDVVVVHDPQGLVSVAVTGQDLGGVYLSSDGGEAGTFRTIGLQGVDARRLVVQEDGPRRFVLACIAAMVAGDPGSGVQRIELLGPDLDPRGWVAFNAGWAGGSCWGVAVVGSTLLAASYRSGVLRLDLASGQPVWRASDIASNLPLSEPGRFEPIDAITAAPNRSVVLAGGPAGVFRTVDTGATFTRVSRDVFDDLVTLPPTWLFCSGAHRLEVTVGT